MDHRAAAVSLRTLAPLLSAVTLAEQISRDVTARQARLAPPRLRKVLHRQSLQEAAHLGLFATALRCLPNAQSCPTRLAAALDRYAAQLHRDLDQKRLADSMVGLHCVLEGLGSVALEPPPGELARLADRVVPLRAMVHRQELAHLRLGEVWVPRLCAQPSQLRAAMQTYVELGHAVLEAGLSQLDCLAAHRSFYRDAVGAHFGSATRWLREADGAHVKERAAALPLR